MVDVSLFTPRNHVGVVGLNVVLQLVDSTADQDV